MKNPVLSRPRLRAAGLALAASAASLAGCYRYVPAPGTEAPSPGASFRARLTPEGTARLAPVLGPDTDAVDGRVYAVEPTALVVHVSAVHKAGDARWTNRGGERVTLPRDVLAGMERRTLDRGRTLRAVAISVAGAAAAGWLFGQISGGAESRGQTGPVTPQP